MARLRFLCIWWVGQRDPDDGEPQTMQGLLTIPTPSQTKHDRTHSRSMYGYHISLHCKCQECKTLCVAVGGDAIQIATPNTSTHALLVSLAVLIDTIS